MMCAPSLTRVLVATVLVGSDGWTGLNRFWDMVCSPLMHGLHDGFESQTERGDFVFHLRWHLRIDCSLEESLFLHVPQLVCEHFLCNSRDSPLKVGEPLYPLEEIP